MGSQAAVSFLTNLARVALGLGAVGSALQSSLFTVDGGERAVLFDRFRGVMDQTIGEGTHFLIPWLQKPLIFDIRTKPHTFASVSGTKDLQMVNLTLRVLYRPEVCFILVYLLVSIVDLTSTVRFRDIILAGNIVFTFYPFSLRCLNDLIRV